MIYRSYDLGYCTNKMDNSVFLEKLEVVATLGDYSWGFVVVNVMFSRLAQFSSLLNDELTVRSGLL